jgi:hypothetical protein
VRPFLLRPARATPHSSDGVALLANIHVGGIPRSTDQGATWVPTIDIDADVHEVCAHPTNPQFVAAAAGVGLCVSMDAGATWTVERDGLHAPHCSGVAFAGSDQGACPRHTYERPPRGPPQEILADGGERIAFSTTSRGLSPR